MARSAGTVRLEFVAGTAGFVADVNKAKASVKDFGESTSGSLARSTATVRLLEGNLAGGTRAVTRFLTETFKLGPVLQAAFPVVGAVLLGKALIDVGDKMYQFYKDTINAAEKVRGAFEQINAPLRLTNAELQVSNDRLENEIAKLEGRPQNGLKLALDEAIVSADKLAAALNRDLDATYKLLKQDEPGAVKKFFDWFVGAEKPEISKIFGGETGHGGLSGRIASITAQSQADLASASSKNDREAIQKRTNDELIYEHKQAIKELDKALIDAMLNRNSEVPGFVEKLKDSRLQLLSQINEIKLRSTEQKDLERRDQDEAGKNAAKLTEPYNSKIGELKAKIEAVRQRISAIGLGPEAQAMAKGFGSAEEAITAINKRLAELGKKSGLTTQEKEEIQALEIRKALLEMDAEHLDNVNSTITTITEQIRAQELLTEAIGKGYQATRKANIEASVMKEQRGRYGQPGSDEEAIRLRLKFGELYDAQQAERSRQATNDLTLQAGLETRLAEAQALGGEEIERLIALENMRKLIAAGATGAQIMAENTLYYSKKRNETAKDLATLKAETDATQRLVNVQLQGAEALRKQGLENKYLEMQRTGKGDLVGATRAKDELDHQSQIREEALKTGMAYYDQVQAAQQHVQVLKEILAENKDNLAVKVALKKAEDDVLRALIEQKLATGSLKDGLHAFFLEMQREAKKPGQILYDSMTQAVDQVSDELAKLFTGQKTDFGKMLQGLGQQAVREAIKAQLQNELGKLGGKFGITAKNDGSTEAQALWVRIAGVGGGVSSSGGGLPAGVGGSSGIGSLFGGGTSNPFIWNFGGFMAGGGDVAPGTAYMVGEKGPEILTMSGAGHVTPMDQVPGGASYYIDARDSKADVGDIEKRVQRSLVAVHGSAVRTSLQVQSDRLRRMP